MKHYKVVHVQRQNYPVAYLSYDTKTQQFSLRIRKDVKLSSLPGMMRLFAQKGLYEPGEEWSKRWVQERIVPMDRHGIGIALRENGMMNVRFSKKVRANRRWMICWFCPVKVQRKNQSH